MPKLEWLRTFVVFAEHLSFTRAAEAMHLSQPALHAQVRLLSEAYERPLYLRVGRSLVLTAEGERVLAFARDTLRRCASFEQELREGAVREPVVLAAGEGAFLYLLSSALLAYRAEGQRPLRLLTRDREGCVQAVRGGVAQLAVAVVMAAPVGVIVEPLVSVPMAVALPQDHPLAALPTLGAEHLEGQALVLPPRGAPLRQQVEGLMAGRPWQVAVEARGWPLVLHFVGLGLGLGVVNGCVAPPAGVVIRPLSGLPAVRYSLMRREGAEPEGDSALLRDLLRSGRSSA